MLSQRSAPEKHPRAGLNCLSALTVASRVTAPVSDLKGSFDFARMQVLVVFLFIQLLSSAILPILYSYFQLGHTVMQVYEHVLESNVLVAFDTALCLSLLMDMVSERRVSPMTRYNPTLCSRWTLLRCMQSVVVQVASGVVINQQCSAHASFLQEQEMQRSFALTNPDARVDAGGEKDVIDSIHQLKALRERLMLQREAEKLRVYGVPLDEHIVTVRGQRLVMPTSVLSVTSADVFAAVCLLALP
jgi:hypothetical protein